jgi:hypothetical protein
MSRKRGCYDNARWRGCFHTLKPGLVHHRQSGTRQEATRNLFHIEASTIEPGVIRPIGYISPIEIELKAA